MSRQQALQFIERLGDDLELQTRLRRIDATGGLAPVVELAAEFGYHFDEAELRAAFADDWQMRRRFYGGTSRPPEPH